MNNLKRTLSMLLALSLTATATACGGDKESSSEGRTKSQDDVSINVDSDLASDDPDIKGQTIYWLGEYDLNPTGNDDRSVALSLFEDVYGAKVEYIQTSNENRFTDLANRINAGDPVEMFPYEWDAVPNGVTKGQYDYLDDYIDLEDPIWDGMEDVIESMKYNGHYYVVPYTITDYIAITYSRSMIAEEGLEDPYELYKKGEWDWDKMMEMMKAFVANGEEGDNRFGIAGWYGQAVVQSTGETIVKYDGEKFSSNVANEKIEKAELMLEEISKLGLHDTTWHGNFPTDGNVLFYGMALWGLSAGNAKMEPMTQEEWTNASDLDTDLFIVPFPKMPGSDKYYLCGNTAAKMLVKGSDKGDAVATYIKCERLAATQEEYVQAAKEKALIPGITAAGKVSKYMSEEQYDFMMSWYEDENIVPMFDFGYGMGSRMSSETYDYNTRGVMNNFMDGLLTKYEGTPDTWAEMRAAWESVVEETVEEYNNK